MDQHPPAHGNGLVYEIAGRGEVDEKVAVGHIFNRNAEVHDTGCWIFWGDRLSSDRQDVGNPTFCQRSGRFSCLDPIPRWKVDI